MMRKWEIVRPESGEESGIAANSMPCSQTSQRAAPRRAKQRGSKFRPDAAHLSTSGMRMGGVNRQVEWGLASLIYVYSFPVHPPGKPKRAGAYDQNPGKRTGRQEGHARREHPRSIKPNLRSTNQLAARAVLAIATLAAGLAKARLVAGAPQRNRPRAIPSVIGNLHAAGHRSLRRMRRKVHVAFRSLS
jgi:hypothetical protein